MAQKAGFVRLNAGCPRLKLLKKGVNGLINAIRTVRRYRLQAGLTLS